MNTKTLLCILVHNLIFFHYGNYAQFTLVGSPQQVVVTEVVTLTLTCTTQQQYVRWFRNSATFALITGENPDGSCQFSGSKNTQYTYGCDSSSRTYTVTEINVTITEEVAFTTWVCAPFVGSGAVSFNFSVAVPVSSLSLVSTAMDSSMVEINETNTKQFECRTNIIRPAASIEWYLGEENITSLGTSKIEIVGDEKVISSSTIVYTADKDDNGSTLYCSAVNIPNRNPVKSDGKILNIQYGPARVAITPTTTSYTVTEAGYLNQITCSAVCNPNCTMIWTGPHIPQGTTSILNLQNIDRSHEGNYYCTASNSIGSETVTVKVFVYYGPRIVDISPETTSYAVTEKTGIDKIICSADCKPNCTMTWTGPNLPKDTTSALNLKNIDRNQAGSFHCTASNNIGSRKSITVQIIVNYAPETTPTVQQTPEGVIVPGKKVTLTCTVSGGHPLAVLSWDCNGTNINNTSGNTVSSSIEFTADSTYNNKICNCSATHFVVSYRHVVQHKLEVYCSQKCLQNQEGQGLFAAGISSLVIGLLSLILGIFLNARWFFRLKEKKSKRLENYTEFNTKSITETTNTYDVINQTTNIGIHPQQISLGSGLQDTDDSQGIDNSINTYEDCQPDNSRDQVDNDTIQMPTGSHMTIKRRIRKL